jgi:hypothetical protein
VNTILDPAPTLLSAAYLTTLPESSEALDELTQAVVVAWVNAQNEAGGYPQELQPVIDRIAGERIGEQYRYSWPDTAAHFSGADEQTLQAANLTAALNAIAAQVAELTPKPAVISGAMLIPNEQKRRAESNAKDHAAKLTEQLVLEGIPEEMAQTLANTMAMVGPRTLSLILDVSEPTLSLWRTRHAGPPFSKNPGRAGAVRYRLADVLAWMFAEESIR